MSRRAAAAFIPALVGLLAGPSCAAEPAPEVATPQACANFLSRADSFGRFAFAEVPFPGDNGGKDDLGVHYQGGFDKHLEVGAGSGLPWGLAAGDDPATVRNKLATLWPEAHISWRRDRIEQVLHVWMYGCLEWVEVGFSSGKVDWVSINAQP